MIAYVADASADMQATYQPTGDEESDTMYQKWFEDNIQRSYSDNSVLRKRISTIESLRNTKSNY